MAILSIDRSQPFNPELFLLEEGWSIAEEDERSLALTEVDLNKIRFETCLRRGEQRINGEEKIKRLKKSGHIRLDAKIFQAIWDNQQLIPEDWKEQTNDGAPRIYFDGTILYSPDLFRCVFYFCWDEEGKLNKYSYWLNDPWEVDSPSAVLLA